MPLQSLAFKKIIIHSIQKQPNIVPHSNDIQIRPSFYAIFKIHSRQDILGTIENNSENFFLI